MIGHPMACRLGGGLLAALSLVPWLGPAGCAINPVSGRPEVVLVSAAQEQRLGDEEAKKVEADVGVYDDAALGAYLTDLGRRLAEQSPRKDVSYTFRILNMVEPNAFALPGGHVYVSRGLLALVNSEDELAGTVGHEVGHVAARHSVEAITRTAPFAIITGLTAGVTGLVIPSLGRVIGGIGNTATSLVVSPFNRQQEREADEVGQEIAAKAGWDPAGLSTFLGTLERDDVLRRHGPRKTSFFDTHPATPERVKDTAARAKQLSRAAGQPISDSTASFLARLDGLVVGPRAADGLIEDRSYLHPDLDIRMDVPERWTIENAAQHVAAANRDGTQALLLNVAGSGEDPLDGARALEESTKTPLVKHVQRFTVNGLAAAGIAIQTETKQGPLALDLVWMAHAGRIYQLAGASPAARSEAFRPVFDEILRSFRPLTKAERAGIREQRLRLVHARHDEPLDALAARTHSAWTAEQIAVANGLAPNTRLAEGTLVKIVVAEPYRSNP